jgi:hypothetical protein
MGLYYFASEEGLLDQIRNEIYPVIIIIIITA